MDIFGSLINGEQLVAQLYLDIKASVEAGGGALKEGEEAIGSVIADPKVRSSFSALITALKA